jgi:hypothetical protein
MAPDPTTVRNLAAEAVPPTDAIPLHYTARAGLLAELSRQTYDSLYKAIREAVLNGIDAGATLVRLDFGSDIARDEVIVEDDGDGMDLDGLRQSFMSLGGSAKYADATKFGRIGIGSLALLTYAREAVVETKRAGRTEVVEAHLYHPQTLDRGQRAQALGEFPAGVASERPYEGPADDHFTRVRLVGLNPEVRAAVDDPTTFYGLLEQLRRVLPLPLRESRLLDHLAAQDPELVAMLRAHAAEWSVPIRVRSPFHDDLDLTRRTYGDGDEETWTGRLHPILKTLRVVRPGERREVTVAGFLASQQRAAPEWSGLTARVQNVAVEERSFFDVTADPGFRKYITGEVFILGDVDTDRLININRTSFNRESRDYALVQRFIAAEIETFKRTRVAQPQRQKVVVRRAIEDRRRLLDAIANVAREADRHQRSIGARGLPSSNNGSLRDADEVSLMDSLDAMGAEVVLDQEMSGAAPYRIVAPEQGDRLRVTVGPALAAPRFDVAGATYAVVFRRGDPDAPAVLIRNRPRQIVFNLGHKSVGAPSSSRAPFALALELAYLLRAGHDEESLYDRMLEFVGVL